MSQPVEEILDAEIIDAPRLRVRVEIVTGDGTVIDAIREWTLSQVEALQYPQDEVGTSAARLWLNVRETHRAWEGR